MKRKIPPWKYRLASDERKALSCGGLFSISPESVYMKREALLWYDTGRGRNGVYVFYFPPHRKLPCPPKKDTHTMDSGRLSFVPAQFSSSVAVRNHHVILALRRNWHRAARGQRMYESSFRLESERKEKRIAYIGREWYSSTEIIRTWARTNAKTIGKKPKKVLELFCSEEQIGENRSTGYRDHFSRSRLVFVSANQIKLCRNETAVQLLP